MQKSYLLAAAAVLVLVMQTPLALAQSAPAADGAAPPAATSPAPAATPAGPHTPDVRTVRAALISLLFARF